MAEKKTTKSAILRVTSKKDGFRRAGRIWSGTSDVPVSDLSEDQIEQLKREPMLRVEEIDTETEG